MARRKAERRSAPGKAPGVRDKSKRVGYNHKQARRPAGLSEMGWGVYEQASCGVYPRG